MMKRSFSPQLPLMAAVLCASSLLGASAHAALFEDAEARRAILEMRQRVDAMQQNNQRSTERSGDDVAQMRRSLLELQSQIETLKADQATQERQAAQAALDRLQQAQARGDALQARLAAEETHRQTQAQEHAREIKRLTTGRPCLNAGTVRLLNEPAIGLHAPALPAPASGADAADAPAASDTDVAGWIDGTRHQYDACRSRLDALIDWHQEAADGHR